jgi:peptide/nickel transport system substrate-binding protein
MRYRPILGPAALLALILTASACSGAISSVSATGNTGHTLNLSFLNDIGQPPDPDVYYAGSGLNITTNVYQGLVQYAPDTTTAKIVPDLATSWTVSANDEVYTFHLRHGVLFHDGTPFTSAAVGASFARRAAVAGGPAYMVAGVASVTTPNTYTAVVTLKSPNSAFMDYLASPFGPKMESPTALAKYAGKDHDQTYLETHDIGTGPYTLSEAIVGQKYQLKAFSRYWGAKPYYTTVNFPVIDSLATAQVEFNEGHIDALFDGLNNTVITSYAHTKNVTTYVLPTFTTAMVTLNPTHGLTTSEPTRRALLKAVDEKALISGIYGSSASPTDQMFPNHMLADSSLDPQNLSYDSGASLKAVVKTLPAADKAITIGWETDQSATQLAADDIAADLDADGLKAQVIGYTEATIFGWGSNVSKAPNMLIGGAFPDAADPYSWGYILWDPAGGLDTLQGSAPGLAATLNTALATDSTSDYLKAAKLASQAADWLNVAQLNEVVLADSWLTGIRQAQNIVTPETLDLAALGAGS